MQAGLGDPKDVNKAGVPLKIKLEHVGKHLRDHANFRIEFDCNGFDTLNQKTRGLNSENADQTITEDRDSSFGFAFKMKYKWKFQICYHHCKT